MEPRPILKLDEVVVNRIAAGEVVQRPFNALKELIENSLDAGAKNIQVTVNGGGMSLLQIQDDGSGIRSQDLPILCERFTTSKLKTFDDLSKMTTYGFRGEALASISHVAHLTVTTKTSIDRCAQKAEYRNGQMIGEPKMMAGRDGTIITIEDLFYNMEARKKALKNESEEYKKILDIVSQYSIHNASVGFTCKKLNDNRIEIRTPSNSTVLENIKLLYSSGVSRELLELNYKDVYFEAKGFISNVNYSMKKGKFLLFINHRLVESRALKKALDTLYSLYLPKKSDPFVYMSLEMNPINLDVNVHPTKHEVHFLYEAHIIETLAKEVEKTLLASNNSRTFLLRSLLPNTTVAEQAITKKKTPVEEGEGSSGMQPKNVIRTCPSDQKLDKFFLNFGADLNGKEPNDPKAFALNNVVSKERNLDDSSLGNSSLMPVDLNGQENPQTPKRREMKLKSLVLLREKIVKEGHTELTSVVKNFVFVGCVDKKLSVIQDDSRLYLVNNCNISAEFFYQKIIKDFGNFGIMNFTNEEPFTISDVVHSHLKEGTEEEKTKKSQEVQNFLLKKRAMLKDYFSFSISPDGTILTLPLVIDNYVPDFTYLGDLLLDMYKDVDWSSEMVCFTSLCHYLSLFYSVQKGDRESLSEISENGKSWGWTIEHILYPEFRKGLIPPSCFVGDSTFIRLTDLPELYKVFERC